MQLSTWALAFSSLPPSLVRQRLRVGGRWPRYAATSLAFVPTVWFTRQLASVEGGLARRRFFCSRYEVQSDLVDRRRRRARARVHSDRRARCRRRADTGRGHVGIDEVLFLTVGLPARPRASTTEANPSVFFLLVLFVCLCSSYVLIYVTSACLCARVPV